MTDKALQNVRDAQDFTRRSIKRGPALTCLKTIQTALKLLEEKIQEQRGELKPCLLCGGEAFTAEIASRHMDGKGKHYIVSRGWYAGCEKCDLRLGYDGTTDEWGDGDANFGTEAEAKAAWNNRPTDKIVQEFIDRTSDSEKEMGVE